MQPSEMGFDRLLALIICIALALPRTSCYPGYFVQHFSNGDCNSHPIKAYGRHGRPSVDRAITFKFVSLSPTPSSGQLCPGARYTVKVVFPQPRLALLTSNLGSFEESDGSCPNRVTTPSKSLRTTWETTIRVPCTAAGKSIRFKVTSAQSLIGTYKTASATRTIGDTDGKCSALSRDACATDDSASIMSATSFYPEEGATAGGATAGGATADAATAGPNLSSDELHPPIYTFRPIIKGNKLLWQFVHSLLMIVSLGLLLPLGVLLARHKWMFGRDPETGKVSGAWYYLHILVQLLALLAALGGVVVAILAFGWKDQPGTALYLPHKWIGVGVMAMILLQLLVAPIRPATHARALSSWNFWHHIWGRLTLLAGFANIIIGACLVHDLKSAPYKNWLLPACVVLGVMLLVALCLEAFKMQMQRTYRYNSHTGMMLPVMQGHKYSKRRRGEHLMPGAAAGSNGLNGHHTNGLYDYDESAYPEVHLRDSDTARQFDQDRAQRASASSV